MKKLTATFYSDPGHAWLKVPKHLIKKFGLENTISHYSYIRKDFIYLEEDCDFSRFAAALAHRGIELKLKESVARTKSSKIRSYQSYSPSLL